MKKILLLPGLGDVHWVLLKLQDWLRSQGPEWMCPEVSIWNLDNRPRTLEYLRLIPWVKAGEYVKLPLVGDNKKMFETLYIHKGSGDVAFHFNGFDALIGTNGNMRNGVSFSRILQGAQVDYNYGPVLPIADRPNHTRPYFVLCFSGHGMFSSHWVNRMTSTLIKEMVSQMRGRFPGHEFVFTGCSWDDDFTKLCMGPKDFSLVGKTSLLEFFRLLQHSSGYIGWCGGNSILSQHLGVPTVEWWSQKYFPKHDRRGWETPHGNGRPHRRHFVLEVEDYKRRKTGDLVSSFLEAANAQ